MAVKIIRTFILILLVGYFFGVFVGWLVFADDNENDLGLCLNYHQQNACDRVDIKKITDDALRTAAKHDTDVKGTVGLKVNQTECLMVDEASRIYDANGNCYIICDFTNESCPSIIAPQIQGGGGGGKH